ncbi:Ig-like domain-containing protein [Alcanivorax sp. JB21]|uniref:Ig-like domain-containing protein n=1 Tax=Alcanivorax limicola TaxID=2874102 RepID=UPI001CBF0BE9|nr:Ig-like domain-containing protein [Alcanivorax limicola]MBZ2188110.1 Ig-like domain-containing protein [Alcanivorax limicola]
MPRLYFSSYLLPCFTALVLLLSACGGSSSTPSSTGADVPRDEGPDTQPVGTACDDDMFMLAEDNGRTPADRATDVALNSSLLLRFNAPVDPASVDNSSVMLTGPGAGMLAFDINGNTITATPDMPLQPDTEYTLTLTTALRDQCASPRTLRDADAVASVFSTGTDRDLAQPRLTTLNPADGEFLAPGGEPLTLTFNKAIAPASTPGSVFLIQEGSNQPVAGTLDTDGDIVRFIPAQPLPQQTWFRLSVTTNLRDLSGNALQAPVQARFRTGGLMVQLNEQIIRQIPGVSDGIDLLAGELFNALGISERDAGLGGLDNLLVLTLPLVTPLSQLDPAGIPDGTLDGTNTLVAVCNPGTPGERCALSLELNVNPLALTGFAEALADGDPAEALQQIANALTTTEGVLGLELALLAPGFETLLPGPLADAVGEGLAQLQNGLGAMPLGAIAELLGQGTESLVRIGLLNGSLLSLGSADGLSNAPAGFIATLVVALAGGLEQGPGLDSLPLGPLADLLPL